MSPKRFTVDLTSKASKFLMNCVLAASTSRSLTFADAFYLKQYSVILAKGENRRPLSLLERNFLRGSNKAKRPLNCAKETLLEVKLRFFYQAEII